LFVLQKILLTFEICNFQLWDSKNW
jgi:hypothetical protein